MRCYECAKIGKPEEAVATCRCCAAGLCLEHLRETAAFLTTGAIRPWCQHDTWSGATGRAATADAAR